MTFITLSFTRSREETVVGIPDFISIQSSEPALIYFTLDGTLPTTLSQQYNGEQVRLPTGNSVITLSAVAYFLDGYSNLVPSSVFSETFTIPSLEPHVRHPSYQGISYMYPGGANIPFWFDVDGNPKVYIDIPIEEFEKDLIPSERDADGTIRKDIDGGTVEFKPTTPNFTDASSVSDGPEFDPNALLIIIDGRVTRNTEEPLLINSPYMSLRDPEKHFGGIDFYRTAETNYVSGGLVKAHYNRDKGVIVFYYFDSNTGRWIKSIQNLTTPDAKNYPNAIVSNPVVFEWNLFGRYQAV
jgi:hypothetical protein